MTPAPLRTTGPPTPHRRRDTTAPVLRSTIERQHSVIFRLLIQAQEQVAALLECPEDEREPDSQRAATEAIEQLGSELPAHFHWEETRGALSDALEHAPQLDRRAQLLMAQHDEFRVRVRHLVTIVQVAGSTRSRWFAVRGLLDELARDLSIHERWENRLIADALVNDLGGGD